MKTTILAVLAASTLGTGAIAGGLPSLPDFGAIKLPEVSATVERAIKAETTNLNLAASTDWGKFTVNTSFDFGLSATAGDYISHDATTLGLGYTFTDNIVLNVTNDFNGFSYADTTVGVTVKF